MAVRKRLKLSAKYYGLFPVVVRVGVVAYKLQLPPRSSIQPVFHISLMKKKIGSEGTLMPSFPNAMATGELKVEPLKILKPRLVNIIIE